MSRVQLFLEIQNERLAQDAKWGGPAHDDQHSVADWFDFITDHAMPAVGRNDRVQLVRIAALAVAALESLDRQSNAASEKTGKGEEQRQ